MSRSRTSPSTAPSPPRGTNVVVLRGTLSRDPEHRELPSGDRLAALEVTVRPEDAGEGATRPKAESVPVAWFDPPAAVSRMAAGDEVVVVGRVRRRFFRAGGATVSRTEVVAERVVSARAAAKVASALAGVGPALGAAGGPARP
jgi:single-strand DNA-binding protein